MKENGQNQLAPRGEWPSKNIAGSRGGASQRLNACRLSQPHPTSVEVW